MTEEEAKTKFCPHQRAFNANGSNVWTLDGDKRLLHTMCLGSACMAWRIETPERYEEREQQWLDAKEDASVQGGAMNEPFQDKPEGWCGLSGDPRQ